MTARSSSLMDQAPNLELFSPVLHEQALKAWAEGKILRFLMVSQGNHCWLDVVLGNALALKQRGLYESALAHAFTATRANNRQF